MKKSLIDRLSKKLGIKSMNELKEEALNYFGKIKIENISRLELYTSKEEDWIFGTIVSRGLFCKGKVNIDGKEFEFAKEIPIYGLFFHGYENLAKAIEQHYKEKNIPVEIKKEVFSEIDEHYEKLSNEAKSIVDRFPFITYKAQILDKVEKTIVKDLAYWVSDGLSCFVEGLTEDGGKEFVSIPKKTKKFEKVRQELIEYCHAKNIELTP